MSETADTTSRPGKWPKSLNPLEDQRRLESCRTLAALLAKTYTQPFPLFP